MRREKMEKLKGKLQQEADDKQKTEREQLQLAKEQLSDRFEKEQEEMAMEVVHRILSE